jgi:hypothetical protein
MHVVQVVSSVSEDQSIEEFLIAVHDAPGAKGRDQYEGLKAKASDVHNWPNRLDV